MIRRIREQYTFKHPLGTITTEAEVGISEKGRRSLSASELDRLSRMAAFEFLKKNYHRSIEDGDFILSAEEVRAIISILRVENLDEFGKLIGCQKSKVSKILNREQDISKAQAQLAVERLAMELARPGSVRRILGDSGTVQYDEKMTADVSRVRYGT